MYSKEQYIIGGILKGNRFMNSSIRVALIIIFLFAFFSCREKKYLNNKFILHCEEVKIVELIGKDKNDCLLFEKVSDLKNLKEDTVYISVLFKKEFVSDSTKKEP